MSHRKIAIISQKDVESRQYIAFTQKNKILTGWAYLNGTNIRVKSFERGKWENRVAKAGAELVLFEDVSKTKKKLTDRFGEGDFPFLPMSKKDWEELEYSINGLLDAGDQKTEVVKQTKLSSKSFVGFWSAAGEAYYGWAFRNGSTIIVKSFENGNWRNRVIPRGGKVMVFEDVPKTKKGRKGNFGDEDFPLFEYCKAWKSANKTLHKWILEEIDEKLPFIVRVI